ncbi:MAG TPA: glycosyltransferase family 4 protein, partial [Ornithinibacter sp.]|nr:glycosyltransferase family 4 protein [Ornithinibacter sp.]
MSDGRSGAPMDLGRMPSADSGASLKVALIGPTHPYKGGVAAHTTTLAHELAEAGHDVTLVSWSHLYPSALHPGEQAVPGGSPDVEPFPRTLRVLSWARPDTWVRTGRRLRDVDVVVVVHVIPAVVPAHLAVLRAAGVGRTSSTGRGPRTVVIAHNVLPHEGHPGDRQLMEALLRRVDAVVVHSDEQASLAAALGATHVKELDLPPHRPGGDPEPRPERATDDTDVRLLSLGIVRDYKGVDLLVDALRDVPGIRLTVAGELWGDAGRGVREQAADPRLEGRVEVHGGYVPADRIAGLMARHDAVALTYRSATASQNALLARRHGLPVLASAVGTF